MARNGKSNFDFRVWDRITIKKDDITLSDSMAIVNAANERMLGGGGVDGAIHRAAGPDLLTECKTVGGCPTGQARLTGGYRLKSKYIIHTVGPIWKGGKNHEDSLLASCYQSVLEIVRSERITSVAFPSISTGIYGFPIERACRIALLEVARGLSINEEIQRVDFVTFSDQDRDIYRQTKADLTNNKSS